MKHSLTTNHVLSTRQQEILVGSLLGDGHLETTTGGKTWRFIVVQSSKKQVYFEFLSGEFQPFITIPIYTRVYPTRHGESSTLRFATRFTSAFSPYGELFYREKVKVVPLCIEHILTPLGLAIWFMDDGSLKSSQSKGVYFNTQCFAPEEVERLCEVLRTKFGIEAWKRPDRARYRIYVSGKSYERLGDLILPFLTSDMRSKWPSPRKAQKSPK